MRAGDRADGPPCTPPLGADAVDAVGWYALAVTEVGAEVLSDTFARILHRPENTIMSTLERTFQKGMARGRAEGMAEGKAEGKAEGEAQGRTETILRMLHKRFGPLDAAVEQRVRGGNREELDRWTDRILDAASLTEVLEEPKAD